MDLFDVVRACARRWYIFLPLLLITAWFSYSSYSSVQPVYYSNAVIGLAPPSTRVDNVAPGVALPRNGLLDIGGAPLIANMTAVGLREPSVVDRVVAAGGRPDYVSRMFPVPATSPQLPMIMIESTAPDPAAATKTLELVVQQSGVSLRNLQQQAQVADDQMVAPFVVSPPSAPAAGTPSRTRSTIAIFIAGAVLSVLVTVLAEVLLTRRRSRARQRRPEAEPQPAADHNREEDEKIEFNGGPENASADPSIRRGANGLPDTLSVSDWAPAQSEATAGANPAHPPKDVAEPKHGAPVAEGAIDGT